ncbi:LITAF-like zinc ribbon domain-containing protein [Amylocarpus encephaloides]|uniref:LITAF-like zinc ribbon domain-containing protein n=1 Tax=Amylocarpus encephaloides TaxID=45428 RepID=A0A9P8C9L9_9HELO|nr:LITAF-like zinc ribbon domain-containing protein [Amylocarpus encephaloides]
MAATWDQKQAVPEYSATPPAGAPPASQTPIQYQQTGGTPQPQYFDPNVPQQMHQNPQMVAQPQGIPQQPQVVYMQQSPGAQSPGAGQQLHQQQSIPMQQQHPQGGAAPAAGGVRQYQNVTPLASLSRSAAPVDCPACGQRAMTKISYLSGNYTHAWAVGICCFTGCLCFIPYIVDGFKNVDHNCGNCGVLLATWHRSGSVDVHQHQ